jgi:hypothetical protein
VTDKLFQPCLMFVSKIRPFLLGTPVYGSLMVLPTNFGLEWKRLVRDKSASLLSTLTPNVKQKDRDKRACLLSTLINYSHIIKILDP